MFDMPVKKNAVSVIAYRKMAEGLYDVCAVVSRDSRDDVASAFRESTHNRMAVVKGTYRPVASARDVRCRFVARETVQVKSYNDTASMTALGNGEFIDTAENIWSVINDGKDKHLVLKSTDDLADILDQIKKRNGVAVHGSGDLAQTVDTMVGDFAGMIKPDGSIAYGFVGFANHNGKLEKSLLNPDTKEVTKLDAACVVESIYDEYNKHPDIATLQGGDLKKVWDYLSKIYPPEFIAKYKAQVGA